MPQVERQVTRAQVLTKAREYLGTPFHHQGRVQGLAVDCIGLGLCVAEDCGLCDIFGRPFLRTDYANYSAQPMGDFVHRELQRRLIEKPIERMKPGDLISLRVPTDPCHVAFVTDVGMLHAFASLQKVVEHVIDDKWQRRIVGCFSFPGAED